MNFDMFLVFALFAACLYTTTVYGVGSAWYRSKLGVSLFTSLAATTLITGLSSLAYLGVFDMNIARVSYIFLIVTMTILGCNFVVETRNARAKSRERKAHGTSTRQAP